MRIENYASIRFNLTGWGSGGGGGEGGEWTRLQTTKRNSADSNSTRDTIDVHVRFWTLTAAHVDGPSNW